MSNSCSDTLLSFHFPEVILHNFVFKFHTHSLEQHQPIEVKPYHEKKKVNRATISPIIRDHRTQGLNSSTCQMGQTRVTNSQAAAHESWLRCSPCTLRFSRSNPYNYKRQVDRLNSRCMLGSYIQYLMSKLLDILLLAFKPGAPSLRCWVLQISNSSFQSPGFQLLCMGCCFNEHHQC